MSTTPAFHPGEVNPLICDDPVDTVFRAACALKYLARVAEDRADHERLVEQHVVCGFDPLTADQAAGQQLVLLCVASALDSIVNRNRKWGEA